MTPNDPLFPQQSGLTAIGVPIAWNTTTGQRAIRIAVIDTGVNPAHEDMAPNLRTDLGYDFVDNDTVPNDMHGHGTALVSIAAGRLNNGKGVAGLAPKSEVFAVRVSAANAKVPAAVLTAGVDWAVQKGATIILIGLSADPTRSTSSEISALRTALARAANTGAMVVAPVGEASGAVETPADDANVVGVTATTGFMPMPGVNTGPQVDYAAPGDSAVAALAGGYTQMASTAVAAAIFAGTSAMLWPDCNTGARERLLNAYWRSVSDYGNTAHDNVYGWGRIRPDSVLELMTPVVCTVQAVAPAVKTPRDTTATIVLGAEPLAPSVEWTITGTPAHGTLTGRAPNMYYAPVPGFSGVDSFAYQVKLGDSVSSATVMITVEAPVSTPPPPQPKPDPDDCNAAGAPGWWGIGLMFAQMVRRRWQRSQFRPTGPR